MHMQRGYCMQIQGDSPHSLHIMCMPHLLTGGKPCPLLGPRPQQRSSPTFFQILLNMPIPLTRCMSTIEIATSIHHLHCSSSCALSIIASSIKETAIASSHQLELQVPWTVPWWEQRCIVADIRHPALLHLISILKDPRTPKTRRSTQHPRKVLESSIWLGPKTLLLARPCASIT